MTVSYYIKIAVTVLATTYGYGEGNCGDVDKPRRCEAGAITASGEPFKPTDRAGAVAAPFRLRMRGVKIYLREVRKLGGGPCVRIRINDKMHPRYIGERGFDLTPGAVEALTGQPAKPYWSGRVEQCVPDNGPEVWKSGTILREGMIL